MKYIIGLIVYALLIAKSFAATYTKIPEKQEFIEETLATLNGTDVADQLRAARSWVTGPSLFVQFQS